jgi:hypothetical protein
MIALALASSRTRAGRPFSRRLSRPFRRGFRQASRRPAALSACTAGELNYVLWLLCTFPKPCPRLSQLPTLLKQIPTPIGRFHFVADRVRQGHLADLSREVVNSAHQSENVDRKPCAVISELTRWRAFKIACYPKPGNTLAPSRGNAIRIASAASESGNKSSG